MRVRRVLRRLPRPKVWRSLLLGLTDPANDAHWDFVAKRDTPAYLDDPEPWFAPGAVQHLAERLGEGARVFEWGAGASTLWFAARRCPVRSFETEPEWIELVAGRARDLVDIRLVDVESEEYIAPDLAGYRVVVIDGRRRRECALHAARSADAGALVIFDDSHRATYGEGVQALRARAVDEWHFPGHSATLTPKLSSIFQLG